MMRTTPALALLTLLSLVCGCTTTRTFTIFTRPDDATIKIDGVDVGPSPVRRTLTFSNSDDVHVVIASRRGYRESSYQLTMDEKNSDILIELKPLTATIHFTIEPVSAILKIDGDPVNAEPVKVYSKELEFTLDERNRWTTHTITAERPGFIPAEVTVSWPDKKQFYTLNLQPQSKDLHISSEPPGARVTLDNEVLGTTPLVAEDRPFPVNIDTNQHETRWLKLEKAGYDPVELEIGWDEGKSDYHVDFEVKTKQVRITTDPPGAKVQIDGARPDREGAMIVYTLTFAPDERGELPVYHGVAQKDSDSSEWEPARFTIGWDDGKIDYPITLKEILTRPLPMLVATMKRGNAGWECLPTQLTTIAMKDTSEGSTRPTPLKVASLEKGQSIGSMALSPDGRKILYTILSGKDGSDFRSRLVMVPTIPSRSAEYLTDGSALDITPSFTPGGDKILFASNRAGRRLQIWSMSATGQPGVTREITSESHDLWPSLDSDPRPRLYYQAMVDTRLDSRIFMTPLGTVSQTDLTLQSGTQPRVSPRNDGVVFCSLNEQTGKRDIYRMSDRGGAPDNLTSTPDADECDPVWSRDGTRIAFASDRGADQEGRRNYDIWVIDLAKPREPIQITSNGSHDDNPLFDPSGGAIYFRSNRGGSWGIWKISLR